MRLVFISIIGTILGSATASAAPVPKARCAAVSAQILADMKRLQQGNAGAAQTADKMFDISQQLSVDDELGAYVNAMVKFDADLKDARQKAAILAQKVGACVSAP